MTITISEPVDFVDDSQPETQQIDMAELLAAQNQR